VHVDARRAQTRRKNRHECGARAAQERGNSRRGDEPDLLEAVAFDPAASLIRGQVRCSEPFGDALPARVNTLVGLVIPAVPEYKTWVSIFGVRDDVEGTHPKYLLLLRSEFWDIV